MHWLSESEQDKIRQLSLQHPSRESCGFVLQNGEVVSVDNVADNPTDEFAINPLTLARYEDHLKGVWHSHRQLAGFSPLDQQVLSSDTLPWAVYCMADNSFHQCDPTTTAPYEGRPYVFGVYDCYSLVVDYLQELGVTLPKWKRGTWGEWNTPEFRPFDDEHHKIGKPVTAGAYKKGDILLFNIGDYSGHTDHLGVFTSPKRFLHHPTSGVSRYQTFGGYWERRLNWVIRPNALWSR